MKEGKHFNTSWLEDGLLTFSTRIVTAKKDQQFKEAALQLIAVAGYRYLVRRKSGESSCTRSVPVVRVLQALRQPRQNHQSSPSSSISVSSSCLYSLKLVCRGTQTLEGLCSIIENCPPSLKELTLHSHQLHYYYPSRITYPTPILQRLESIKNSNNTIPSTNPSASRDLLGAEWVCSGLETLSICFRDLAEYEAEQEMDKDGNHSSPSDTDAELALYLRQIHNVPEFHCRLRSITPSLQNPSLAWGHLSQDIPYDPYSHDIDFPDNLRWMNLKWFPVSGGLESTATAQEVAIQSQSRKKSNQALQRRLQDSGILVSEVRMGFMRSIRSAPVGITTGGRIQSRGIVWEWTILMREVSFVKSRGSRRRREEMKRGK